MVFRNKGEPDGSPLRRAAFEFVVIVAGVLAAFAADEWAQEREELRELNGHLVSVLDETRSNLVTIRIIKEGLSTEKFSALETVIAHLESGDATVDDPDAFIQQLGYSTWSGTPWFTRNRFDSLKESGLWRLLGDDELAGEMSATFQAPQVLMDQVRNFQGEYPVAVNEIIPASYQAELNTMRGYAPPDALAPEVAIDITAKDAIVLIDRDRERLLRLARGEVAVTTAKWYALSRLQEQFGLLEEALADRLGVPSQAREIQIGTIGFSGPPED